jgi:ribosomal protein S18 acetylase RimI-like enzyme
MEIHRLDLKTDLLFARYDSDILDRGAYTVVRTPSNPTFHWGNFLIFPRAPEPGDASAWSVAFLREFGHYPALRHRAYTWGAEKIGETARAEFAALGVGLETNRVLTLESAADLRVPPKFAADVEVRALRTDAEWEAAIEDQIATRRDTFAREDYEPFKRRQFDRYRRMHAAGLGGWFGAFLEGRLVADLGLYHERGVGRFQSVGTHPDFRRRGICARLVHDVARTGLAAGEIGTLVMVADDAGYAAGIYESVGFRATAMTEQLYCSF